MNKRPDQSLTTTARLCFLLLTLGLHLSRGLSYAEEQRLLDMDLQPDVGYQRAD